MDSDTYHECNLCVAGGLDFVLSIDLNAKFIKFFEISAQPIAIRPHLFNFYYSIDNNEFGIGDCPHILHRFEIDIKDADSNPIEDMTVTAKSDGTVKYLAGNFISDLPDVLMTDSDGKIVLFSNLSTDLTFEKDGYEPTNLYVYAVKDTADTGVMVYLYNDETEIVDIGSPIVITIPYGQPVQTTTETTTSYEDTETTTAETAVVNPEDAKKVKQVALGWEHSACITEDGTLYTWGGNSSGRLGNGTEENSLIPIKIMDNVKQVALGGNHSACITEDGSLYTWGSNYSGQLGNGESRTEETLPIKVMDNVKQVALGCNHSACITEDGSLYIWGDNMYGQLGNGTYEDSEIPIKVMDNVRACIHRKKVI